MLHSLQTRGISNEYSLLGRVCQVSGRTSYRMSQDQTTVSSEIGEGGAVGYEDRAATEQVRKMEGECFDFCLVVCFLF